MEESSRLTEEEKLSTPGTLEAALEYLAARSYRAQSQPLPLLCPPEELAPQGPGLFLFVLWSRHMLAGAALCSLVLVAPLVLNLTGRGMGQLPHESPSARSIRQAALSNYSEDGLSGTTTQLVCFLVSWLVLLSAQFLALRAVAG
jgi:hypothetical protein